MSRHSKEEHTGMLASANNSSISRKRKKALLAIVGSILIVATIIGLATGIASSKTKKGSNQHAKIEFTTAHLIVKSSCESTLYPDLCYSSLANEMKTSKKPQNQKDVIEIALNITIRNVKKNQAVVEKIIKKSNNKLSKRAKGALEDCLETIDETLDELEKAVGDLEVYPYKKSLKEHADDLKTLLSAAMTNPETCIDGFSHDEADKKVREELLNGQEHIEKLCSNSLAMICNMTNTDIANEERLRGRKIKEEEEESGWPKWVSGGDRRLLQSSTVTPNVVVAADGSGNYKTISEAVNKAPTKSSKRYVIRIKAGVYRENVDVPKTKTNIMFLGDGKANTIITASKNVVDGSTTFNSATVAVVGERFLARDITFQNTAGPSKHQAVALRVGADLSAFYRCDILAYQDSLYVHSNRQFFVNCLISGTVDFIFGNAAVVLQNCDIHARRPSSGQKNMVTAQGRTDPNQNTGIVIQKSRIGATSDLRPVQKNFPTYLGRPWKEYSRTIVMQSTISDVINSAGWHEWTGSFALNTLFYGEYGNSGAGAGTSGRVKWRGFKMITSATEALSYSPGRFIAGATWLGSTGFPFSSGL